MGSTPNSSIPLSRLCYLRLRTGRDPQKRPAEGVESLRENPMPGMTQLEMAGERRLRQLLFASNLLAQEGLCDVSFAVRV